VKEIEFLKKHKHKAQHFLEPDFSTASQDCMHVPSGRTQLPIASMGHCSAAEIRGVSRGQVSGGSGGGVVKLAKLGVSPRLRTTSRIELFL